MDPGVGGSSPLSHPISNPDMKWKRYDKKADYSYTLGVAPTLELLRHRPLLVLEIILSPLALKSPGVRKIVESCSSLAIPHRVDDLLIRRLSSKEDIHALAFFRKYPGKINPQRNQVVLVNPDDMGNLGTIIRAMAAFGYDQLAIIRPAADFFHPKTLRASMGASFRISHEYFESYSSWRKHISIPVYLFSPKGREDLRQVCFQSPYGLVFGNEGAGLPPEILASGSSLRIPFLSHEVDSLSLPAAVAVTLYQAHMPSALKIFPSREHSPSAHRSKI